MTWVDVVRGAPSEAIWMSPLRIESFVTGTGGRLGSAMIVQASWHSATTVAVVPIAAASSNPVNPCCVVRAPGPGVGGGDLNIFTDARARPMASPAVGAPRRRVQEKTWLLQPANR